MADDASNAANHSSTSSTPPGALSDSDTPVTERVSTQRVGGRTRKRLMALALLVVLLAIGVPYGRQLWHYYQTHESTDDAYVIGDIIPISARVHGTVVSVHIDDHQRVEAGQLLVRLDPRDLESHLQQAEAAVAVAAARLRRAELEVTREQQSTSSDTARTSATLRATQSAFQEAKHGTDEAQAHLRILEAAVTVAQADLDAQDAHLDIARMGFERIQRLVSDGVVAQQQFDEAQSVLRAARAERRAVEQKLTQAQREVERVRIDLRSQSQVVERSRARVDDARALLAGSQANRQNVDIRQAQVEIAQSLLQQKRADLDFAKLQVEYTTLRAPVAGIVAKVNVEVGRVLQAGRPLLALVPLHNVWVEANFKETQLRGMHPGQKVTLKVDAYPGEVFHGTVESISPGTGAVFSLLPPENATGNFVKVVQRVPVKIVLDAASPPDSVLRPGMSVVATVATRE